MYREIIMRPLRDALADSPVVLVNGARQTGKTTLVQELASGTRRRAYVSLDDAGFLAAARADPAGFLAGLPGPVTIDEVQHAPELFPAIKAAVDRRREPGRFLLTGSANVLLLPRLSELLAGRMEILTLWPLAQAEIEARRGDEAQENAAKGNAADAEAGASDLIARLFSEASFSPGPLPEVSRVDLIRRVLGGGFPEPLARPSEARRRAWFGVVPDDDPAAGRAGHGQHRGADGAAPAAVAAGVAHGGAAEPG